MEEREGNLSSQDSNKLYIQTSRKTGRLYTHFLLLEKYIKEGETVFVPFDDKAKAAKYIEKLYLYCTTYNSFQCKITREYKTTRCVGLDILDGEFRQKRVFTGLSISKWT